MLQKIRWFNGSRRNIRDVSRRCLDVHGNSNTHRRHVHWYKCHNGLNQAWFIDRKGYNYPSQPLSPGVRFQIKSRMHGNRAIVQSEHIGGHQYRIRIQDNDPSDRKQWFTFDRRTQTIRQYYRRGYCIGNQVGYYFRTNVAVNVRPYKGRNNDRIRWYNGSSSNIRNNGGFCLDVHGNSNTHRRHVIYYKCHNGRNQAWYLDQVAGRYHRQPFRDGIKF
jgi:hypothetical protein